VSRMTRKRSQANRKERHVSTTSSKTRRTVLGSGVALIAVAVALGIAACGGDDDDDTTAATTGTTGATGTAGPAGETVDLTATDFEFSPADPTVKAGEVTFDLTNDGAAPHNITVEGPSGKESIPTDLQSGEEGELTVDLDESGTYTFYCPVGNHRELGMVGEVTVEN
jgi:plastocyanin